jgi:SpoIID/LytB domain protein
MRRPTSNLCTRLRSYGAARGIDALREIRSVRSIEVSAVNAHGRPRAFSIAADGGVRVKLTAEALRRALDFAAEGLVPPEKSLWSSNVRITISRRETRIDGHGHGHGAGLCQYGAEALARSGEGHESILAWYYPGAELVQAYV